MGDNFFLLIIVSYLFGSIPFAYVLPLVLGYGDIRKIGSGNVGATNVLRTGKKSLAIATAPCKTTNTGRKWRFIAE